MSVVKDARAFLIVWNNKFPLDREYRKKHSIAFNSPEHRALHQLDIYLEWLEDELFKEHVDALTQKEERRKEFEKGIWLKEGGSYEDEEAALDLFNKIDTSKIKVED